MSHIPSSAMKHAGPTHHDETQESDAAKAGRTGKRDAGKDDGTGDGIGTGAWIAIGGTLLAGVAAAIVVPLLKARSTPVPKRRGKKATPSKAKARKSAED